MAKNTSTDYFAMFVSMGENFCKISKRLKQILSNYDPDKLQADLAELHVIENKGDEEKHALVEALVKEFLPPIEREDILSLSDVIDDVTDSVEDILIKAYMYDVKSIRPEAIEFMGIIEECCAKLLEVLKQFANYKRAKGIKELIIEINNLEEVGDRLHRNAVRGLFIDGEISPKELFAWTKLYSCFEKSCDTCEHLGGLVEQVILKNS
ncbi:hypothetical protein FACS1894202_03270 [Clostridia bacterium]|nr:hypothetical protein FACS1894202_03270 [Clostridia bacterium]